MELVDGLVESSEKLLISRALLETAIQKDLKGIFFLKKGRPFLFSHSSFVP